MQNKKPDLFDPQCPTRKVLELVGSKWSLLLLCALHDRKTRTGDLRRKLGNVSQKMLTQTLRQMELNGLVRRISYGEVPPRVEYELTELGSTLGMLVVQIEQWIVDHHIELRDAERGRLAASAVSS